MPRAALSIANAIDVHQCVVKPDFRKKHKAQLNNHRVADGIRISQHLKATLMKFSQAPALRIFVAKECSLIKKLNRLRPRSHPMLNVRTHHGSCSLWSKRECVASFCAKRISFFLHHIARLSERPQKKL